MSEDIRPDVKDLSFKAAVNRMKDLREEMHRAGAKIDKGKSTLEDETYFTELGDEFVEIDTHRKGLERKALLEQVDASTGDPLRVIPGDNPRPNEREIESDPFSEPTENVRGYANPWDLSEVRTWNRSEGQIGSEMRSRALTAIEKMSGTNDSRREAMAQILEVHDNVKGDLAHQALLTSSPAYLRAFTKAAKGQEAAWTDDERDAAQRAMSLTDNAGGFLVPFQLDPVVINTSDGSLNEIRMAAREVVATGDVWNGVSAAETSWSWDAEAAEASDDASTFAGPAITIYKGVGFVPISIEALQDEQNVAQEVGRLLASGKDTLEAAAFATGSGSAQPFGIVSALNTISASIVASTTTDTFGLPDLYALDEGLPARYRKNGSFLANRAIYNDVRQFDSNGGAALWERLGADVPPLLLGRPAYESEDMDGVISTTEDYILVFGDFDNYVIADRVGTTVEFIPHLLHTSTNRPSGQRGWYAYFRAGADCVNNGAFRLLHST
jgi:HK97 family phage major capsid protein